MVRGGGVVRGGGEGGEGWRALRKSEIPSYPSNQVQFFACDSNLPRRTPKLESRFAIYSLLSVCTGICWQDPCAGICEGAERGTQKAARKS